MPSSQIPGFYRLSIKNRQRTLLDKQWLSQEEGVYLDRSALPLEQADRMIENVISTFELPFGLGLNFLIDGEEKVLPMVVEEPSIVAAISSAAKAARAGGGFVTSLHESLLIGQLLLVEFKDADLIKKQILENKLEIIHLANSFHPNMVARGGGTKDLEVIDYPASEDGPEMIAVHLLIDPKDAMGANLVNTVCEGVSPLIEKITGCRVSMRILSNLADRSLVTASVKIPLETLEGKGFTPEQVRDGIILATQFANQSPYRATTHNKGIMNGIDAVALATANDWRAIEASAHAYAARSGKYRSLTTWEKAADGDLIGSITLPLKVGIVGGSIQSHPRARLALKILKPKSANELARVMAAAGLAQNFSALRALITEGIQKGHMSLHARSVAAAANTPAELFESVVEKLIESEEIKVWKAMEIIEKLELEKITSSGLRKVAAHWPVMGSGKACGKIIITGEHAVVYGASGLAAPISLSISTKVKKADENLTVVIPRWGVEEVISLDRKPTHSIFKALDKILETLELSKTPLQFEIQPQIPRGVGLGSSAALMVSIIRALNAAFEFELSMDEINRLAFEAEKVVHGHPSGIDNTVCALDQFIVYKKGEGKLPNLKPVGLKKPLPFVIGVSKNMSLTSLMVEKVRQNWKINPGFYEKIFKDINEITLEALEAIQRSDLITLGQLMNINQGLLNAIQVSHPDLENMCEIARNAGALGAKLTGGGGGGAMIALGEDRAKIKAALQGQGYEAFEIEVG